MKTKLFMAVICQAKKKRRRNKKYVLQYAIFKYNFYFSSRTRKREHQCKQLNWKSTYKVNKLNHFLFSYFLFTLAHGYGWMDGWSEEEKIKWLFPYWRHFFGWDTRSDGLHVSESMHMIKMKNMRSESILYVNVCIMYLRVGWYYGLFHLKLMANCSTINTHTHTQLQSVFSPHATSSPSASSSSSSSSLRIYNSHNDVVDE